ncbi:MAG: ABC transporter substrate-binding protein [Chloroflexi bacterium]|nr:ABC transporter substrate-binding protein [Chloroflexota bacterium]
MKNLAKYVIVLVLTSVVAACGAATPAATTAPKPLTTVKSGFVSGTIIAAPMYIAVDKGYFKEQGLDVQLDALQGGSDAVVQVASAAFDVAAGGAGAGFWNAVDRGVKFVVVSPLHTETARQATPLVTGKASFDSGKIKSAADLKGKKVAVNAKPSATEYWLEMALNKAGLTIKDVDEQVVAFTDVPAALQSGSIDAAMLGEPLVTLSEDKGLVVRIADGFIPDFQVTAVYYNADFAKNKPDAAKGFISGFLKGCRDLQGNGWKDDANAKIIEKYTKVPADVVKRAATPTCDPNGAIHVDDFMKLQDFLIKRGDLTYSKPVDFKSLVDASYVQNAVKVLGEYKPK